MVRMNLGQRWLCIVWGAACLWIGSCSPDPEPPGWQTGFEGYPTDEVSSIREATLEDDASGLSDEPGSHEFWNFFAFDREGDLGISMIFLSADMWNADYREATYAWREDPGSRARPVPGEHFLLQLNVTKGTEKVFTTIRVPPGATAEFSSDGPQGRIGDSTFSGSLQDGIKTYQVSIDFPDLTNSLRLEAEVTFEALSPGLAVDGLGMFGGIPGGSLHHWQWPIGYPQTGGSVRITDREGTLILEESFTGGGGYVDHMWGEGLMADMLDSWYFGRLELGEDGALIYVWLTPRDEEVEPYGRVFRIPRGELATMHEVTGFTGSDFTANPYGLEYYRGLTFTLAGGGTVSARFGAPAVEDWPFQVAGPAVISADIPDDIEVRDLPGLGEYLWQPGIDSETYKLLYSTLEDFPWYP